MALSVQFVIVHVPPVKHQVLLVRVAMTASSYRDRLALLVLLDVPHVPII